MTDSCPFVFAQDAEQTLNLGDFVIRVPAGIESKGSLFSFYAQAAELPDYFGYNWDAFDEVLRDLSWITEPRVVIAHSDLPLANDTEQLKIYLMVLKSASSERNDNHELIVSFPPNARGTVEDLARKP